MHTSALIQPRIGRLARTQSLALKPEACLRHAARGRRTWRGALAHVLCLRFTMAERHTDFVATWQEVADSDAAATDATPSAQRRCLSIAVVILTLAVSCQNVCAQVALPRIVEHPQLADGMGYYDSQCCYVIDQFREFPLEEVGGISLNIWTYPGPDWWPEWHPECRYDDIEGIVDDGYVLGTFVYYPTAGYLSPPSTEPWDELRLVTEVHIEEMGARLVVADELLGRCDAGAEQHIDMSDQCKEASSDVLFLLSTQYFNNQDRPDEANLLPQCEGIEVRLAGENPPRPLSDVIDVIVSQFSHDDDFHDLIDYAEEKGMESSKWVYTSYSLLGTLRYWLRKPYYHASAVHLFHIPGSMGWVGTAGLRQEVERMLHPRFVVKLDEDTCVAAFDTDGYAVTTGNLYQQATSGQLTPTTDPEVIVRDSSTVVALFDADALYLKGKLYELVSGDLDGIGGTDWFRVKGVDGNTVAAINATAFDGSSLGLDNPVPTGSLMLKQKFMARNLEH